MRIFLCAIFIISVLCAGVCYAQDTVEQWQIKKVDGEVFAVDYFKSNLTVKFLQNIEDLTYDQIVFTVKKDTAITKGDDSTTLDDIAVGDHVQVRYYNDQYGFQKVLTVIIMV